VAGVSVNCSINVLLYTSYYNAESHSFDVERYTNNEPAYVDQVKMLFDDTGEKKYRVSDVANRSDRLQRVFIMLRIKVSQDYMETCMVMGNPEVFSVKLTAILQECSSLLRAWE